MNPQTRKQTDILRFYVPITRTEETPEGHLIVEGICYANAKCGDGYNLKRTSMVRATPGYEEFGAIREMHQPSAVGTALSTEWVKEGCVLRSLIVDTDAKEKVRTNVYKGYSVGVRPRIMRGSDVEECDWVETSLVDRPYDKDATFSSWTVQRAEDADSEYEVTVYDASATDADILRAMGPLSFKDLKAHTEAASNHESDYRTSYKVSDAMSLLHSALAGIAGSNKANKDELIRASISQFADHVSPILADQDAAEAQRSLDAILIRSEGDAADMEIDLKSLTRAAQANTDQLATLRGLFLGDALNRVEAIEASLVKVPDQIAQAINPVVERVTKIEKAPARVHLPVLNPAAVDRTFAANVDKEPTDYRKQYDDLTATIRRCEDEGQKSLLISRRAVLRENARNAGIEL